MWDHLNKQFTGSEVKNLGFHLRTSPCLHLPASTDEGFSATERQNTASLLSACCCYTILHSEISFRGGVFSVIFIR